MTKNILIIGAGKEQIPAYITAKKMDLNIIATDMDQNAPAFQYADQRLIGSTRDVDQSLSVVKKFTEKNKIDGVITIANDVPLTVATIADYLKLPSISVESAEQLSNKLLMKERFTENNVNTPIYSAVHTIKDVEEFSYLHGFPIILKPIDGRGSRGVMFINDFDQIKKCYEITRSQTTKKKLMVEQYIKGKQLSVESIFVNKKYIPIAFADRNYADLKLSRPFFFENGGVMPSRINSQLKTKINRLIKNASKALGISWGTVKADIVIKDKSPVMIELAGRLSGGQLSTFDIPNVYGVDIVKSMIKLSLDMDLNLSEVSAKTIKAVSSRYIFSETTGKIKKFEFPHLPSKDIFIEKLLQKGQEIRSVRESTISTRAGMIRVLADDVEKAEKIAEDIFHQTKLLVS